jgi:hypothetical protein
MNPTAIFWPMMAHALLVYLIYLLMYRRRLAAVRQGKARVSQFRDNREEPAGSLTVRNSLANQFELPVLFHSVCLALFVTGGVNLFVASLAWLFVLSRYLHAFIHVTSNRIRYRSPMFAIGFVFNAILWICLALHIAGLT